ncbi:MAG: hypothetical protein KIT75_07350 [Planctomycetota bacterium]|nr:hypothetical protein [Planctomycetota bacterium]
MGTGDGDYQMSVWYRLTSGDLNHVATPLYANKSSLGRDVADHIAFGEGSILDWPANVRYWAEDEAHDGEGEDFLLSIDRLPVVSERLKHGLERFGQTMHQLLPVGVFHSDGRSAGQYFIINVLDVLVVLDLERSRYDRIEYKQNAKGETIPDISGLWKPVLRRNAADGHHLFRCAEYPLVLVASEEIKQVFDSLGVMGATFTPLEAT